MKRKTKWTIAILAAQVPLSALAWWLGGPWATLPVLMVTNGLRIFVVESWRT